MAQAGSLFFGDQVAAMELLSGGAPLLEGLTQEQRELLRHYSAALGGGEGSQGPQSARASRLSFESGPFSASSGTPTHAMMMQSHGMASPPPHQHPFTLPGQRPTSTPHTPMKPYDAAMVGLTASALSTPNVSLGSLGNIPGLSAMDVGSPMNAQLLSTAAEHMLMMPSSSLLSVHAPAHGHVPAGAPPPPPPPSTPTTYSGGSGGNVGMGMGGMQGQGQGQGQLTMAFANALTQAAAERGVDPSTLVQLLQSPKLLDVLLSKAGDLQQPQAGPHHIPPPPPPPPPRHQHQQQQPQLLSRMSAPSGGEWAHGLGQMQQHMGPPGSMGNAGPSNLQHIRPPPPPPPPRSSTSNAPQLSSSLSVPAVSNLGSGSLASASSTPPHSAGFMGGGGSGGGGSGGGAACPATPTASSAASTSSLGSSSGSLEAAVAAGAPGLLTSAVVQEFVSARGVLVQLMLSAYAFLNSDSIKEFYDKLAPVAALYDDMHELPVVQKRKRCMDMSYMRSQLLAEPSFSQILSAVCQLRHHLHALSRKVLVMNHGPDGIPIDLLLGSMSTELYHIMKSVLPQEVCDFFGSCLPHPRLAVLVFAEFTSVDPMPTLG